MPKIDPSSDVNYAAAIVNKALIGNPKLQIPFQCEKSINVINIYQYLPFDLKESIQGLIQPPAFPENEGRLFFI